MIIGQWCDVTQRPIGVTSIFLFSLYTGKKLGTKMWDKYNVNVEMFLLSNYQYMST